MTVWIFLGLGILIPILAALSIVFTAVVFEHKQKTQLNKIREMELQKEIMELEIEKQNSKIKLLEIENKEWDKIIETSKN